MGTTRYLRKPLAHSLVDGEVVVMDTEADEYVCFGATGTFIWNILEKPASLAEIASAIASTFQTDEQTAHTDCSEFIGVLLARNYVDQVQA